MESQEHFFPANGHTNAGKKKSIWFTAIGPTAHRHLTGLINTNKLGKKNFFLKLVEIMKAVYLLITVTLYFKKFHQRFKFYRKDKHKKDTILILLQNFAHQVNYATMEEH